MVKKSWTCMNYKWMIVFGYHLERNLFHHTVSISNIGVPRSLRLHHEVLSALQRCRTLTGLGVANKGQERYRKGRDKTHTIVITKLQSWYVRLRTIIR